MPVPAQRSLGLSSSRSRQALAVLRDGARLRLRAAEPQDTGALDAMISRCSPLTRYRRFCVGTDRLTPTTRALLLDPPGGIAHAAFDEAGAMVAIADLAPEEDQPGTAEMAIIVEDAWQRRGLGTAMARQLLTEAESCGIHTVRVVGLADNLALARVLRQLGRPAELRTADGLMEGEVVLATAC